MDSIILINVNDEHEGSNTLVTSSIVSADKRIRSEVSPSFKFTSLRFADCSCYLMIFSSQKCNGLCSGG